MTDTPSSNWRASRLNRLAVGLLFVMPALILGGYFYGSKQVFDNLTTEREVAVGPTAHDGAKLYAQHCSRCHGLKGDGKGLAELYPPARHFGYEKFRFSSTDNAIPTDEDLMHLLKSGIQGSAMPAFGTLQEGELAAIIFHVRQLTRRGLYDRITKEAWDDYDQGGDEPNLTKIAASVDRRCQIGKPLSIPASFPEATPESLANGKRVFLLSCASCHGQEGRGDGAQTKDPKFVNENGTKAIPRDLTAGIYKVGGDHASLYARIMLGIPGSPMPASGNLPQKDVLDLVNYVKSLPKNAATTDEVAAATK